MESENLKDLIKTMLSISQKENSRKYIAKNLNLDVQEDDPTRFKLEIMINRGAATDEHEILNVKSHTIPIMHSHFIDLNK